MSWFARWPLRQLQWHRRGSAEVGRGSRGGAQLLEPGLSKGKCFGGIWWKKWAAFRAGLLGEHAGDAPHLRARSPSQGTRWPSTITGIKHHENKPRVVFFLFACFPLWFGFLFLWFCVFYLQGIRVKLRGKRRAEAIKSGQVEQHPSFGIILSSQPEALRK